MTVEQKACAKKLARIAGAVGALLAVACHFVPARYQDACHAVAKVASITVGGCS